jgi:hypothetical protein
MPVAHGIAILNTTQQIAGAFGSSLFIGLRDTDFLKQESTIARKSDQILRSLNIKRFCIQPILCIRKIIPNYALEIFTDGFDTI